MISPILLGQELKYIVSGDENGIVSFWKDKEQLENNCGTMLRGHSSQIVSMAVSKNQDYLFTLGKDDNTILEWKIDLVIAPEKETKSLVTRSTLDSKFPYDECIIRELTFCSSTQDSSTDKLRDSLTLFRGTSHKMINGIYAENLKNFAFEETDL